MNVWTLIKIMIKYGIIKDFAKWNSNNMIKQCEGL